MITDFWSSEKWFHRPASTVVAGTHEIGNFSYEVMPQSTYRVQVDVAWLGIPPGNKQVMAKIAKTPKGIRGISNNLSYISRDGKLEIEDQDGQVIQGKEVVIDVKDSRAVEFYTRYDFTPFMDEPVRLFLPMSVIGQLFA